MKNGKRIVLVLSAIALCGALLFLPYGWTNWMDRTRANCVGARPQIPGLLAPEARRIPALYALHSGEFLHWNGESDQNQEEIQPVLEKIGQDLARAGVLTENMLEVYQELLAKPADRCDVETSDQLVRCSLSWYGEELPNYQQVIDVTYTTMEQQAVCFQASIPAEVSAETMAKQFCSYLGLDTLSDWKESANSKENDREYDSKIGNAVLNSEVWTSSIDLYLQPVWERENEFL